MLDLATRNTTRHEPESTDPPKNRPSSFELAMREQIIELWTGYRGARRGISPGTDLRDWLDAEADVKQTQIR